MISVSISQRIAYCSYIFFLMRRRPPRSTRTDTLFPYSVLYDEGSPGFPKGNAFAQAPKHTVNLSANYTRDLGEAGELAASAGYTYQSRVSFQDANLGSALAFQKGYSLLDARLGLNRIGGTNINASVFAKIINTDADRAHV